MSNIRTRDDHGEVWRHKGQCYRRIGDDDEGQPKRTPGLFTDSFEEGDVVSYVERTWIHDDNDVELGSVHRTWSACQMCVAQLPQHTWSSSTDIMVREFAPVNITFSVPGIVRLWLDRDVYFLYGGTDKRIMRLNGGDPAGSGIRSVLGAAPRNIEVCAPDGFGGRNCQKPDNRLSTAIRVQPGDYFEYIAYSDKLAQGFHPSRGKIELIFLPYNWP